MKTHIKNFILNTIQEIENKLSDFDQVLTDVKKAVENGCPKLIKNWQNYNVDEERGAAGGLDKILKPINTSYILSFKFLYCEKSLLMDKINNETIGISSKVALCTLFDLELNKSKYSNRISERAHNNFLHLFRNNSEILNLNLVEFYDNSSEFNDEYISRSPHNFRTQSGETVGVWTFKSNSPKVCPKVAGQPGIDTANKLFGHLQNDTIDKTTFKKLAIKKTSELLEIYLDYLFLSDISIFIYLNGSSDDAFSNQYTINVVRTNQINDINFASSKISFTRNLNEWNESNTVKYDGTSIGEFQVHSDSSRFIKFRFFLKNLLPLLKTSIATNETLGATTEYVICKNFNLHIPESANIEKRINIRIVDALKSTVKSSFHNQPKPIEYVGASAGQRKGSKSSVDFILEDNLTMSVKSNHSKNNKVCPPEIGQPSFRTFDHYFGGIGLYEPPVTSEVFKSVVMDNANFFIEKYIEHLFDCDRLFWVYGINRDITQFESKFLSGEETLIENLKSFNIDEFSFTRDLQNWNESNTIKLNDISIGEFQVHQARASLKFRFQLYNLLGLLGEK